ncbi:DUF6614 family protein [Rhizomicrobium electricum]|jgi:hypothetical protein|uniref:Uncharacterized protein n=1 Tax=Rhizomicrobium electricum TaxID=480070 RepID=A0ABN1EYR3_9PROT|nr:DUF6614 family protein [Rhizomicrobium electricum]NIJ49897.1 hypothetical protein [Rhizomicrobium electricum]
MDHYHAFFDLKSGTSDIAFARAVAAFMEHLKAAGLIEGWHLTRRKLGLGPRDLGEFQVVMDTTDLAQLDAAFRHVSSRGEPAESLHFAVNRHAANVTFALYRDFPDPQRREGEEKF